MKIATWNVNSVNVRLPNILKYLEDYQPDILCLQELKCSEDNYPLDDFVSAGYHSLQSCQKTYNGVSIISKSQGMDCHSNPVAINNDEMRSISATFGDLRVINLYVVNGQSIGSEKYTHKLKWLKIAHQYIKQQLASHRKLVVVGDFNIVPNENDASNFSSEDILCSDKEREALQAILDLGLTDCYKPMDGLTPYTCLLYTSPSPRDSVGSRMPASA